MAFKTVMRIDAGTLRPPVRMDNGFLRADGLVARPGIYEYINTKEDEDEGLGKAGTLRRELRTREEVTRADSLAQYEGAPITIFHPKKMVDSKNVRALEVGTVVGPGRVVEGDVVGVGLMIKDAKAVSRVDSGELVQLSPGYKCELEMRGGFAPEYATIRNPRGYYDFVQRNIRVNHLALVDRARGGEDLRIRLDRAEVGMSCSVERGDCGCQSSCGCEPSSPYELAGEMVEQMLGINQVVTDSVDGHQHVLEGTSGRTSFSISAGSEDGHDHAFSMNRDGSFMILDNAGHSHRVLPAGDALGTVETPAPDAIEAVEVARADDWSEDDHPRAENGEFGEGGGGSSGGSSSGKGGGGKGKGGKEPKMSPEHAKAASREAEDKHNALVKSLSGDKSMSAEKQIHESHLNRLAAQANEAKANGDRTNARNIKFSVEDAHAQHAQNASKIAHASGSHEDHKYAAQANAKASSMAPKGSGRERGHAAKAAEHEAAAASAKSSTRSDAADHATISAGTRSRTLDGVVPQVRPVAADTRRGATTMDPEEQIRSLKAQLAESEKLAATHASAATTAVDRADRAEARVLTLEQETRELETKIAAGSTAMETAAIKEQAERADRAEAVVRMNEERFDAAVRDRTATIRRALVVMGEEFNPDRMSNREIQSIVVKRLDAAADVSGKVTDAYIQGRFDSLVELHQKTARSISRAGASLVSTRMDRADTSTAAHPSDARAQRANSWRNQWKNPLPSSRNAKKEA